MSRTMRISFSMNSNKCWSTFRDNFAYTMWHLLSMIIDDKEANEDEEEEEEGAKESNDDDRDEKKQNNAAHITYK